MKSAEKNEKAIRAIGLHGRSDALAQVAAQVREFRKTPSRVLVYGEVGTGKDEVVEALLKDFGCDAKLAVIEGRIYESKPEEFIEAYHGGRETHQPFPVLKGARPHPAKLYRDAFVEIRDLQKVHPVNLEILANVFDEDSSTSAKIKVIASARWSFYERFLKGEVPASFFFGFDLRIRMPRLCERLEDIDLLAHFLLERIHSTSGLKREFNPEAIEYLKRYPWPGNSRELSAVLFELVSKNKKARVHPAEVGLFLEEWRTRQGLASWQMK
jgi:DNA-binding NtrC family response regulator